MHTPEMEERQLRETQGRHAKAGQIMIHHNRQYPTDNYPIIYT